MGFIYRKSFSVGLFRLNLGKRGIGVSAGLPGFRVSQSSSGRRYTTFNLPGSGMSYRTPAAKGCLVPFLLVGTIALGLALGYRLLFHYS
jgi:hypothetical protein